MAEPLRITRASFVPASPRQQKDGLMAWVMVEIDGVLLADGLALRRTPGGRETLSYPRRRDRDGHTHAVLKPVDEEARRSIQKQVLDLLARGRAAS